MSASPAALVAPRARRARSLRVPALIAAGGMVATLVLTYIATNVYSSLAQRDLSHKLEDSLARWSSLDPLARSQLAYAQGDPVARVTAPSIGLDVIVAEGSTPAVMRRAPGHIPATVIPGDEGVAIVTANRFGFGSFFLRLDRLAEGDRIVTESAFGRTTYTVVEVRTVGVERLDLSEKSTERVLVLFGSARVWGGSDRIVVRAVVQDGTTS